jgi:hypothetical protein
MVVAAELLVDPPLVSPELALVDPALAAELRSTLSPEERWPRPPARVEDVSAQSGEDPPSQLEAAGDAGNTESGVADQWNNDESIIATQPEQVSAEKLRLSSHYPVLPAPEPDDPAFEDFQTRPSGSFGEASAVSDDDAPTLSKVAEVIREAEAVAERVLVDDYLTTTPEQTPAENQRTRSHYPDLPAPEDDSEAADATDAAFRRIRESLTEADESPSGKRRIRRGFTLGSGVVAVFAVAALEAGAQFQVAQVLSLLPF